MKIAITGSSGFAGSSLIPFLESNGHEVTKIVRSKSDDGDTGINWVPENKDWHTAFAGGLDVVIHLAGENIASDKWTREKKMEILNSRVFGTRSLCESILKLDKPPGIVICASAVGFYGDRGDEVLTESSVKGELFFSKVCEKWEAETASVSEAGIRVVNLRFGMILSSKGGALPEMLTAFKKGMAGKLGSGKQYVSWIVLEDALMAIQHVLTNDSMHGPVNVTSPQSVTNKVFTKTLGKIIKRPTFMPVPAFSVRLAFGEIADEVLLASVRVKPEKLLDSGFQFKYPELDEALRSVL